MNNEEVDRRIAFIIEQQAQFGSDIQQLQEAQSQTDQTVARMARSSLGSPMSRLWVFTDVNAKINSLVDSQIHTDDNLRNLIAVVDRYLDDEGNGARS